MYIKIQDIFCQTEIRIRLFEHILTAVWPEAILQDLYHVYAQIEKGIVDMQTNQREILCSKQWNQITKRFWLFSNNTRTIYD